MNHTLPHGTSRWYREPMVWLLLAILLLAFIAGSTVAAYAMLHPDKELHSEHRSIMQ